MAEDYVVPEEDTLDDPQVDKLRSEDDSDDDESDDEYLDNGPDSDE